MYSETVIARFWAKVDRSGGPDACWLWTAGRCGNGYGAMVVDGRQMKAHRLAMLFTVGELASDTFVCHHCDNPPCCNPAHLYIGTAADNNRDTVRRGRHMAPGLAAAQPYGAQAGGRKMGRMNGMVRAKLTFAQAQEIRARWSAGGVTQRALAREYGVVPSVICAIIAYRCYQEPA
jgi:hypothetical protein